MHCIIHTKQNKMGVSWFTSILKKNLRGSGTKDLHFFPFSLQKLICTPVLMKGNLYEQNFIYSWKVWIHKTLCRLKSSFPNFLPSSFAEIAILRILILGWKQWILHIWRVPWKSNFIMAVWFSQVLQEKWLNC